VNEHIAAAVIGLDEAVAAFSIEELDCPSHGHRENSSPVLLCRYAHVAQRPTDIRCRKRGHLQSTGITPPVGLDFYRP
jgi:hypothetical protein